MSAPKRLFILYNSFSLRLIENLHEQKHFLKAFTTHVLFIAFFCEMYNKEKLFTALWSPLEQRGLILMDPGK